MPDALDTVISQVPEPVAHSFKENDVLERYKEGFAPKPEPAVEAAPVVETPKTEATPAPSAKSDDIPDEILGIAKTPVVDELDKLLTEEPKGHVKNENFKNLQAKAKARIEAEQAEKAQIRKELEEVRSKLNADFVPEKIQKRLEQAESLLKEREEELGKLAVERSPMFKERFTKRKDSLSVQLEKTIEQLGLDKNVSKQLVHSDLKKRVEILDNLELTASGQGYITSLLQQHDQVSSEEGDFLSDWQTKKAQMEQEEAALSDAQKAKRKEMEDRTFEATREAMSKTFAPLRKIEGNDAWNAGVDEAISTAKRFYDGQFTDEQFSEIVLAGAGAKRLGAMYERLKGMYDETAKENASLKAASPSAPPPGSKPPVIDDSKLTQEERFKRTFDQIVGTASNNGFNR